jgi:hypothetical protein
MAQRRLPLMSETGGAALAAPHAPAPHRSPSPSTPAWQVVGADATGKRFVVACAVCRRVAVLGADALRSGAVSPCDCASRATRTRAAHVRSFAGEISSAERYGASRRHREGK